MLRVILIAAKHQFLIGGNQIPQKAAFFDLDGTLITVHVWHGIMDYFKIHNLRQWTHRYYMAYHYPLYIFWKLGLISEQSFRKPWPAHLGWYLRGDTVKQANEVWDWVAENRVSKNWRQDVCQVLHQHNEQGDVVLLVSGTPVPLLARLAQDLDVDHVVGTELEIKDGVFTGHNSSPACIGQSKVSLTQEYLENIDLEINCEASFAYADTLSDAQLLSMVGNPVATYPDTSLRQLAIESGWKIFPE